MYSRSHAISNSISTAAGQNSRHRQLNGDDDGQQQHGFGSGATGGIGGEVARQLRTTAGTSRAATRCGTGVEQRDGMAWVRGDAMNADEVRAAAQGCSISCTRSTSGIPALGRVRITMLDNTIAAARIVGATIVLPGTVYNFGPGALPLLTEDLLSTLSPQRCHPGRNGTTAVRASKTGTRVLIVRAGDFFGQRGEHGSRRVVKR